MKKEQVFNIPIILNNNPTGTENSARTPTQLSPWIGYNMDILPSYHSIYQRRYQKQIQKQRQKIFFDSSSNNKNYKHSISIQRMHKKSLPRVSSKKFWLGYQPSSHKIGNKKRYILSPKHQNQSQQNKKMSLKLSTMNLIQNEKLKEKFEEIKNSQNQHKKQLHNNHSSNAYVTRYKIDNTKNKNYLQASKQAFYKPPVAFNLENNGKGNRPQNNNKTMRLINLNDRSHEIQQQIKKNINQEMSIMSKRYNTTSRNSNIFNPCNHPNPQYDFLLNKSEGKPKSHKSLQKDQHPTHSNKKSLAQLVNQMGLQRLQDLKFSSKKAPQKNSPWIHSAEVVSSPPMGQGMGQGNSSSKNSLEQNQIKKTIKLMELNLGIRYKNLNINN